MASNQLGNLMKVLRTDRGLDVDALPDDVARVGAAEGAPFAGPERPSVETIEQLAFALGIRPEHLESIVGRPLESVVSFLRRTPQAQLFLELAMVTGLTSTHFVELSAALQQLGPGALLATLQDARRAKTTQPEEKRTWTLRQHLDERTVVADLKARTWSGAMTRLVDTVVSHHPELVREPLLMNVLREPAERGWFLGGGIAIPHAVCNGLDRSVLSLAHVRSGLPVTTPDGEPVHLIFLLLDPPGADERHLHLLARLAHVCSQPGNLGLLRATGDDVSLADALVALDHDID